MAEPDRGAMWAVQLGASAAEAAIGEFRDRVCVAVVNSEYTTVLAGDAAALATVVQRLETRGVFCRQVRVDFASHSPLVEPLREPLTDLLPHLRPRAGRHPIHSTVLDRIVDGTELDARYWADNLCQPVRFVNADQDTLFIEISPHPVVRQAIEDTVEMSGTRACVTHSLRRDEPEYPELLTNLAFAYTHGCEPAWAQVFKGARFVPTPSYPWQRRKFWVDLPERSTLPLATPTVVMPVTAPQPVRKPSGGNGSLEAITRQITERTAAVLALPPDELDPHVPLITSGLDSLLATKLAAQLKHELNLHIPIREFLSSRTLVELAEQAHARAGQGS
jgi:acyl transferase domain-containing protein